MRVGTAYGALGSFASVVTPALVARSIYKQESGNGEGMPYYLISRTLKERNQLGEQP